MSLHEWELLDCHEDGEKKLSIDQKMAYALNDRSISVSDQQHPITGRAARDRQEIAVQADEDAVSQISGQKLIGDVKKDSERFRTGVESDVREEVELEVKEGVNSRRMNMAMEKGQKWGISAICSFGIAVAATICTVLFRKPLPPARGN